MELSKFEREIQSESQRIKHISDQIGHLLMADRLFRGLDLSDVQYSSVSYYAETLHVSLILDSNKRDSRLAHKIAQRLGCKFNKSQSWNKESLVLTAHIERTDDFPAVEIEINGSVPKTCKITVREIPLTEEEIEAAKTAALENVKTVRIEREIHCR